MVDTILVTLIVIMASIAGIALAYILYGLCDTLFEE